MINDKRAAAGCDPVAGEDRLRAAADRHAVDMRDNPAVRSDPSHLGSDGSTPSQRIADAGYAPVSRIGEIMYWASGPPGNTPSATVDWWMNSPRHREIIETCAFTHAGVGLVYPGGTEWYTTVDFGAH
ncbi:CAP domain-containing protein [Nostocoides sp. F2B08]|uniref:CAP domain-containing protein n=1 Tax=Nostocoides sp. F2B08 TaxID=2653936 RepID=UPI00186B4A69|nr:CAP domain-containing protein [Tetrasphaera sp. F2B08]